MLSSKSNGSLKIRSRSKMWKVGLHSIINRYLVADSQRESDRKELDPDCFRVKSSVCVQVCARFLS